MHSYNDLDQAENEEQTMIWGTKEEQEKELSVTKNENTPTGFICNYMNILYLSNKNKDSHFPNLVYNKLTINKLKPLLSDT